MQRITRVIAVVFLAAVLTGGYCVYQGITASLHAENVLHAATLVIGLIDDHVTSHDGAWPRSWAELEALPPREWAMFAWPKDSTRVQQYINVDFSSDPQQLAMQCVDEFDAVQPIGPYYPFKDRGGVQKLLEHLREHQATEP